MIRLGVNIDHVATIREARKTNEPDPVVAAGLAELGGADGITIHLREDRRHIQDRDLYILKKTVKVKLNLEMSVAPEIVDIALDVVPDQVTIVPEKRQEITTEGGLNVKKNRKRLREIIGKFKKKRMVVSLFVDSERDVIKICADLGADAIELHTGKYANARFEEDKEKELKELYNGAELAGDLGLRVNAGHGLTYTNIIPVLMIPNLEEVNIGHSIISRAVFVGIERAVREMKEIIHNTLVEKNNRFLRREE